MPHEPMRPKGFRHPSGRPIKRTQRGVISKPRALEDQPLTPGLRKNDTTEAVGFTVDYLPGNQPDDDDEFEWERETE